MLCYVLSFMFMGLTYTIPPPPEEGITINFGFDDLGGGEIQPEEVIEELQESVESVEEVSNPEVFQTPTKQQNMLLASRQKKKAKKETPKDKVEQTEDPQPKSTQELYTLEKVKGKRK